MLYAIEVYKTDINREQIVGLCGILPYRFETEPLNICAQFNEMFKSSFLKHVIKVVPVHFGYV
jgi:hypothetical protein